MTDKKDAPEEVKEEAVEQVEAAAEKVEEQVEAKEAAEEAQAEAAQEEAPVEEAQEEAQAEPAPDAPKKGYMQRRKSFAQGSVPNAHRGYNPKTPVVMLGIIFVMLVASFILASIAG